MVDYVKMLARLSNYVDGWISHNMGDGWNPHQDIDWIEGWSNAKAHKIIGGPERDYIFKERYWDALNREARNDTGRD